MDIDKLLGIKKKIRLSDKKEPAPATYEEWVSIHGLPECVEERGLEIIVKDYESEVRTPDFSNIFYENKQGKRCINYGEFAKAFRDLNNCVYCNGLFYTPEGALSVGKLRQDITFSLMDNGWTDKLDIATNSILRTVQDISHIDNFEIDPNLIPFKNGDMILQKDGKWVFCRGSKRITSYRLNVDYVEEEKPKPLFDKWLHDLFEDDDILTVQEILGYVLVPTTAAQEAFFLVGQGGTGKSVLGTILSSILGSAFLPIETKRFSEGKFEIAEAENKLAAYDDDLGEAALESTGTLKTLVTADKPIAAERKYKDKFSFVPYCKVIACANFMLSSLYDNSDGFFRRLHPIVVKKKDPKRETISGFGKMIAEKEKEAIVKWALQGLYRLIQNNWEITWSSGSKEYMESVKAQALPFAEFLSETTEPCWDGDISSSELVRLYARWCRENGKKNYSEKTMLNWIKENSGWEFDYNLKRNNKRVRGYRGMRIKAEWKEGIPI